LDPVKKVVILGAGVSGMAAAIKIKKQDGNNEYDVLILEKNNRAGGLITSIEKDNYWFDSGSYMFWYGHELTKMYPELFSVMRFSRKVWLHKKYFSFPFSVREIFSSTGIKSNVLFIVSLLAGNLCKYYWRDKNCNCWLKSRIGKEMLRYTALDSYIKKLQTVDSSKISPHLCDIRLNMINHSALSMMAKTVKSELSKKKNVVHGVTNYPSGGVGKVMQKLRSECKASNVEIRCNTKIENIRRSGNRYVIKCDDSSLVAERLITSIPINSFVDVFSPKIPLAQNLEIEYTNSSISMFLVSKFRFSGEFVVIYAFEPQYSWKKLTSIRMPNGMYSIVVEATFSKFLDLDLSTVHAAIKNDLVNELKVFQSDDILDEGRQVIGDTYPIFTLDAMKCVENVISHYNEKFGVIFIGRQGTFQYFSSHAAIKNAEHAAGRYF